MADEKVEVVRSLIELLAIAKQAQPDYIFEQDPRVYRARQLIASLSQVSFGRPPSISPALPMDMVDVNPPTTIEDLDRMRGAEPPWDITQGLDAFMESDLAPRTRTEAVVLILREWLTSNGYISLPPRDEEKH